MTFQKIKEVLDNVSMDNTSLDFKWKFEISNLIHDYPYDTIDGHLINVSFERPDTETGIIATGRGRKEFIHSDVSEDSIVKTAWLLIELVIRHELMEAFKYKGVRIFNPHTPVKQLALAQNY